MEQQSEEPKQSFIAIACVLLGLLSLIPGWWRFFALAALILGIIILKSSRFTAVDKRTALAAIFLGVIGIALLVLNSYSFLKSVQESIQEYSYTAEDVKKGLFYRDQRCNVGIALRDGVYGGSDYSCRGKIFKKVSFQIYGNFIAMGDLNHDDRTDTAIVMVKQYDEEEKSIEIAGFVNSIVVGAKKRQLVFNGSEELSNVSSIEGLNIESGIIVLNFVVCCPTQEKVGTYVVDEVYRILKPIQSSDLSNWKTYRNEEYGIEFQYPADWYVSEGPRDGSRFLICLNPSGVAGDCTGLVTVSQGVDLGKRYEAQKNRFREYNVRESTIQVGGETGRLLEYPEAREGGVPRQELFIERAGVLYNIGMITGTERLEKVFDQMVSTFRFVE